MKVDDLRPSIIRIKRALGKGKLVTRERQCGKTTALLEFVHEHNPGNVIIIVPNWNMEKWTKHRYKDLYPQDEQPSVRALAVINDYDVRGTSRAWVTDEVWPTDVTRKAGDYEYVPFLGGVGTEMCMDRHSR